MISRLVFSLDSFQRKSELEFLISVRETSEYFMKFLEMQSWLYAMRFSVCLICTFLFTESVLTKHNEPAAKADSQGQTADLFCIFFGNRVLMGIKCQMTCHLSSGQKCHTRNLWLNLIGHFRVLLCLSFKTFHMKKYENEFCMQFHSHANQSHFHNNGFALILALKQRHTGTRKWPIKNVFDLLFQLVSGK